MYNLTFEMSLLVALIPSTITFHHAYIRMMAKATAGIRPVGIWQPGVLKQRPGTLQNIPNLPLCDTISGRPVGCASIVACLQVLTGFNYLRSSVCVQVRNPVTKRRALESFQSYFTFFSRFRSSGV